MKTSRLELLNGTSRKGEMSLENRKIIPKLEKFNLLQSRKILRFRRNIFKDICTPLCVKTIICEQQHLLTEFD